MSRPHIDRDAETQRQSALPGQSAAACDVEQLRPTRVPKTGALLRHLLTPR